MKLIVIFLIGFSFNLNAQLDKVVNAIARDQTLGFDQDRQYERFTQMLGIATLAELVLLTDHKSPAVRGYAFWGLAKENYSGLKEIFLAHLNDTTLVQQKNGCMVGKETVISFMRQVATPYMYDLHCKKLDDQTLALVSQD